MKIRIIALLLAALGTVSCTTLYPENSPEREREHEFTEMHVKHLRK